MSKQTDNHNKSRRLAKQQLSYSGLTSNQKDLYHWIELPHYKHLHHLEIYLNSTLHIKLKLVHAEDEKSNQGKRYVYDLNTLQASGEPVLLVYAGRGWHCSRLKPFLAKFREILGKSYVVPIEELAAWVMQQIEMTESR